MTQQDNADVDNALFQTMPRPPRILSRKRTNHLSRFAMWALNPILSFQVGLTAGYVSLIYFGISGFIASPPSISVTTPDWFVGYWATVLIVGAVLASFGSVSRIKIFERLETVGAGLLTLTIGSYALMILWLAYGTLDADRAAAGAGFVALTVPIFVRFMWLLSQLLRK